MNPFSSGSVIASTVLFMCAGLADATVFHTYLSVTGNDANPCSRDQPCRYLPAALAQTEVNGEVTILDSGDYNVSSVNMSQGVTVAAAPGVRAVMVADVANPDFGALAVQLNGPAGSQFTFRNVVFVGRGSPETQGTFGITTVTSGIGLIVEDSEFSNLAFGISVVVDQGNVSVSRSIFQRNERGIFLGGGATRQSLQASIDACTFVRNSSVGALIASSEATISHSRFIGNGDGVAVSSGNGNPGGEAFLAGNVFSSNGVGVFIGSGSFARSTQDNVFYINGTSVNGKLIQEKKM